MGTERIRDEGQTLSTPTGKVLGIVDTRAQLDELVPALATAGFEKNEVLSGEEGVHLLERVQNFFFSDMEERVLKHHIEELKKGHMIILIKAPSDRVNEAVSVASQHGARRLVHFGLLMVTVHT